MKKQTKEQPTKTTFTKLVAKGKGPNILINSKLPLGPALKAYYTKAN